MSEPQRLIDGGSELERELLAAWRSVQPSEDAQKKTLAMLGVAAGTAAVGGVTAAAGGSIAPKAVTAGAAILVKWLALGAVGVAVATAAAGYAKYASERLDSSEPEPK